MRAFRRLMSCLGCPKAESALVMPVKRNWWSGSQRVSAEDALRYSPAIRSHLAMSPERRRRLLG